MKKTILLLILLAPFIIQPLKGQADSVNAQFAVKDTQAVNIKLFESDSLLEITLRFDITTYKRKKSDTAYLDAVLTYFTGKNDSVNKKVKVRARGDIRRTICDFPPMSLNFKLKDTAGGEFIGIDKLKLVPYCKLGYEDYILREYLVYKLYNVLTDNSLRVRLLRINFINTAKAQKPIQQYGFVIEPIKLMAKRLHGFEVKPIALTQRNIKPDIMDQVAIFNFMVGNTDWAVPNQHNIIVLSQPGSEHPEQGIAVAYDFDYTGLVNADYAIPAESLPIKNVRERFYLGMCRDEATFNDELKEFQEKKDLFFKVINDFPYISTRSKKDMTVYLQGFFNLFDKHNSIVYALLNTCKKL